MGIRIRPTDDDYRRAVVRVYFRDHWDKVKAEARQSCLERMIEANQEAQRASIDAARGLKGLAYLEASEETSRLFREHDKLVGLAYPRQPHPNQQRIGQEGS